MAVQRRRFLQLLASAGVAAWVTTPVRARIRPSIRATFYYPWFPETWGSGTAYKPSLGAYATTLGIVQTHIAEMEFARCKAGIASWWGPASAYDKNIPILLAAAEHTRFKWCLYHEREGYEDPSAASLRTDLDYIWDHYAAHPNYLKVGQKPVIFVYADPSDGAGMCQRWHDANGGRFHVCLKLFHGFATVTPQPDSWHQYAPANAVASYPPHSFSISPGFKKPNESAVLDRNLERFTADALAMAHSDSFWHLITTFNEWGEGTAVEPELSWGTRYLDALARAKPA